MTRWASGSRPDLSGVEGSTTLRVRYAETDAMGRVYYAVCFCYFEVGRTELMRTLWKPYRELEQEGLWLPVVEAYCRYLRPSHYDDELAITTRMTLPSALRLRFDYSIRREQDEPPLAEGHTVHCFVSAATGKPVPIPTTLRSLVAR